MNENLSIKNEGEIQKIIEERDNLKKSLSKALNCYNKLLKLYNSCLSLYLNENDKENL